MINLEKLTPILLKSGSPILIRRPAPAPYFHPVLFNLSESPPPGEVVNLVVIGSSLSI